MAFREVVEHPGAVAILALEDRDKVVLVRQYRQPAGSVLLEVPAGKLDPGESPLQCAQRELAEETGLQGADWKQLACFYPSPGFCDEKIYLFLARKLAAAQPLAADEDESVEVVTIPLAEALGMLRGDGIKDAKTMIALQFAASLTA